MNSKRERFCEEYLVDSNAAAAARRAGYSVKTARSQGQRLLTFDDTKAEIARLQAEQRRRTQKTVASISHDLDEDRALAHRVGQAGAAVSASATQAKLHGFMVERHEVRIALEMSDVEIQAELAQVRAELRELEDVARGVKLIEVVEG